VTWRNVSSLGSAAAALGRGAFEAAMRDAGGRVGEGAAEAQLTISENGSAYLLVEEFRKGDDRQVWIASWKRGSAGPATSAAIEKRLLWEQDEAILDAAVIEGGMLVLTPSAVIRTATGQSAPIQSSRPWPRDLRGRLRVNGAGIQAYLPGVACSGTLDPLSVACKASDEPWTIDSGRALLLATFAANRNSFDGRVLTQAGVRKTVAPFYAAAAADNSWILTGVDGRASIFDSALESVGIAGAWGSDVAASDARCGGAPVVLATRAGDGPDAVQAYAVGNRAVTPVGAAAEFPGPVTALWPGVAVVRTGTKSQAYGITVTCGQ
jgi:hypothetical protein